MENVPKVIVNQILMSFYEANVAIKLKTQKEQFLDAIRIAQTNLSRAFYKEQFIDEFLYVDNCALPTKEDISIHVRAQKAFRLLEERLPNREFFKSQFYKDAKQNILTKIVLLKAYHSITQLENLQIVAENDVIEAFVKTVDFTPINDHCLLSAVNNFHNYTRDALYSLLNMLRRDLLEVELITMACANVITGGDEETIQERMNRTTSDVEAIGKHVILWVETMQDLSWPEIPIEFAKQALGFETIPTTSFNISAQIVRDEFEKRGPKESYQVLISETKEKDVYWSVLTDGDPQTDNYANFTEEGMHNQNRSEVLLQIHHNAGPIYQNGLYGAVILFRNKAFFAMNAHLEIGQALCDVQNVTATSIVDFFVNGFYAHAWRLYLLL
uniref:Uncharacterized protein n=1 Tax=Panagrolaimus sp. JU765 TaxID=591449 RepID=A0AC34QGG3_9BILA